MTAEEQKEAWRRGQEALARIMKYVSVDKVEKLADKIEDKDFRTSIQFKMFMNSLK
jgi:hypothetical protein